MYALREFTACMSNYSAVFAPPRSVLVKLRDCLYQITRKYGDGKPKVLGPEGYYTAGHQDSKLSSTQSLPLA
jgi:hypothetical protein